MVTTWACIRSALAFAVAAMVLLAAPASAVADELWVAPTSQQDIGGLGIASNVFWPVTPIGVVRFAWAIPNNLQTFTGAKVTLVPHSPGGASTLNVFVCPAQHGGAIAAACAGPFAHAFTGVPNQLADVDVSADIAPRIGTPGATYLAVLVYTTPTTTTDHIVGLRFRYDPTAPSGVATLQANTFSGTQTAPAFVGDGSGLTNLPAPGNVATLNSNTFTGTQTAPAFVGGGAGLTNVNANLLDALDSTAFAKLGANTFTGTQSIRAANLDMDNSTTTVGRVTKNGTLFLHNVGFFNLFLGESAGNAHTGGLDGHDNTAVGYRALRDDTTGNANTAVGSLALRDNVMGTGNTALGTTALARNTVGNLNTALGQAALDNNTSGGNTAVGSNALSGNTSGRDNAAIGFLAGVNATTGSNNIYVGANVNGVAGESNTIYVGVQGTQTKTFIAGIRGITTANANAIPVMIDSAGQLGTVSSSIRYKEDVQDMAEASNRLLQVRPVTFRYTEPFAGGAKPMQYGLIAEEVAMVFPELVVYNADGQPETVKYQDLSVLLLNELQKQQRRFELLERHLAELSERIDASVTP